MSEPIDKELTRFLTDVRERNPNEEEFIQAVEETARSVMPFYLDNAAYREAKILERLTEPDRIIRFRVAWCGDDGEIHINRAWRVQFCNALGPYKGGLRFASGVSESVLKFLGFEQTFKNALTGLPMGGAKGGADLSPKGRSDREIMRFCHALMNELHRHIGENVDIPAGDIGVGAREISFLFGQYTKIRNRWSGVMTGKGCSFGGSAVRAEATGYGCVYFCEKMLERAGEDLAGKRALISGSGNVALYAAEKAIDKGVKVLTLSDSDGFLLCKDGLERDHLETVKRIKLEERGRISEAAETLRGAEFFGGRTPWGVEADIALPCATQNEINDNDAKTLIDNGLEALCEGANMPVTAEAARRFRAAKTQHAPGKASNAGGVAVSGFEMSQNALRLPWSAEQVDERLQDIMADIHDRCVEYGERDGALNYIDGANIASFKKVADTLKSYGVL